MADTYSIDMMTNTGETVGEISTRQPVLLVFLRHFGCIFCREALRDISEKRNEFENKGVHIILVHMSDDEVAEKYFRDYRLAGITHVSDPECRYYAAYGLVKGSFNQLFGLKNFIRGVEQSLKGNLISFKQVGDGFQMPGIFMIQDRKIVNSYIHRTAADRPDYDQIISCCDYIP